MTPAQFHTLGYRTARPIAAGFVLLACLFLSENITATTEAERPSPMFSSSIPFLFLLPSGHSITESTILRHVSMLLLHIKHMQLFCAFYARTHIKWF